MRREIYRGLLGYTDLLLERYSEFNLPFLPLDLCLSSCVTWDGGESLMISREIWSHMWKTA
jgi:hypothetical protein